MEDDELQNKPGCRDAIISVSEFKVDKLVVHICKDRQTMGEAAAVMVGEKIHELLGQKDFINIIFAAAPSQNEFLSALVKNESIDWRRVNAFHMDEYIGLPENATQLFSSFLKEKIFDRLPFYTVNLINGNATDREAECGRYSELLTRFPPDIVCMGIGENGHLAFNDPPVADFNDPVNVKVVTLDAECRQQQVNDGCFEALSLVPENAITLTIPALMTDTYIYCMVPGDKKARAIHNTLNADIIEKYPSTILRRHKNAVLFLDKHSASLLEQI
jgi:glucosamine-6-phosphate deaminase